jgi:hypothetical protein
MRVAAEIEELMKGLFCRCVASASALLCHAVMSRSANAFQLGSDESTHDEADESGEHTVMVDTRRLTAFDLEKVLAAEAAAARLSNETPEANDNEDPEPTLTVSIEENMRLLTRAFRSTEDEITLETPVSLPKDVPSPLGDERLAEEVPSDHPSVPELASLFEGDDEKRGYESVPELPLLAPDALISKVSGIRPCVSPEHAKAVRDAR